MAILGTKKQQIAVTGIVRSGKTVFLVSLINHLLEHDEKKFQLPKEAEIRDIRRLNKGEQKDLFNYDRYRDALTQQKTWPKKTKDSSHFFLSFDRTDWKIRRSELHFFDFPGERIADAAIAAYPDYDSWSDYILKHIEDFEAYRRHSYDYLELFKQSCFKVEDIISAYRLLMWRLYTNFMPLVSPSTFLLDLKGEIIKGEVDIQKRHSGLPPRDKGEPRDFAPIPQDIREKSQEISCLFRKNYVDYRTTVVLPLFDTIRRSDSLVVLVNIPELLSGGVGRFIGTREILGDLLSELDPSKTSVFKKLKQTMTKSTTRIKRIAFVASQSDLVRCQESEKNKLTDLLNEMTKRKTQCLKDIKVEWFSASAVVSTDKGKSDEWLKGILISSDNPDGMPEEFEVPELPDSWPSDWTPGAYQFVRVRPKVPKNTLKPPHQNNLDSIFDFLTR